MWAKALQLHRVPGSLLSPHSQTWGSRRRVDPREEGLSVGRGITEWKEIEGNIAWTIGSVHTVVLDVLAFCMIVHPLYGG